MSQETAEKRKKCLKLLLPVVGLILALSVTTTIIAFFLHCNWSLFVPEVHEDAEEKENRVQSIENSLPLPQLEQGKDPLPLYYYAADMDNNSPVIHGHRRKRGIKKFFRKLFGKTTTTTTSTTTEKPTEAPQEMVEFLMIPKKVLLRRHDSSEERLGEKKGTKVIAYSLVPVTLSTTSTTPSTTRTTTTTTTVPTTTAAISSTTKTVVLYHVKDSSSSEEKGFKKTMKKVANKMKDFGSGIGRSVNSIFS